MKRNKEILKSKKRSEPFAGKFPGVTPDTDTVPAMLTPHEAVLNRNAAEMVGRDKIKKVNKAGNELEGFGVDLSKEPSAQGKHLVKMFHGARQRFAGGASGVQPIGYVAQEEVDPAWKEVQLMAPHIDLEALKKQAQAQGLSADQVKTIAGAFANTGGGYGDSIPGSGGYAAGGFAAGDENIGYPPLVAQNMSYQGGEGGWWGDVYTADEEDQMRKYQRGVGNIR